MKPMTTTLDINCPPDLVYSYITNPTRFPEWQADVVRVDMHDRDADGRAAFTTVRRIGGTERAMEQLVSEEKPPRRWASVAVGGPIRPTAGIDVTPINGGSASRVTFTLGFEGRGIGVALLPMVRRQAEKLAPVSYNTVKRKLEEEAGHQIVDRNV